MISGIPVLRPALDHLEEIAASLRSVKGFVCLDFDGTLAPLVPRPQDAVLPHPTRTAIIELARLVPVALVTGRELADIRARVELDLVYAANHGFELKLPGAAPESYPPAARFRPQIDALATAARERVGDIPGVVIEHKPYSVTIHYRLVGEDDLPRLHALVSGIAEDWPELRILRGKKVYEFLPQLNWNKGAAVLLLARRLGVEPRGVLYLGDDVTDEHAFAAIRNAGIGILVSDEARQSEAIYSLHDPDEVRLFLERLAGALRGFAGRSFAS